MSDFLTITCPSCGLSRSVPLAKLPQAPATVTCPNCQERFVFPGTGEKTVVPENTKVSPLPEPASEAPHSSTSFPGPCAGGVAGEKPYGKPVPKKFGPKGESLKTTKSSRVVVGFWRRFFADFLDAIILAIPGYGIGYLFRYTFSEMGVHAIWIGLVCSFLYYGIQHTHLGGGQTPGKRLLGIQVLRRDGQYLDFGKSFLRYLVVSFIFYNGIYGSLINHLPQSAMMAVGSVYFLVIIWAFFACFLMIPLHPLKRGLHDIAADSVVVYKGCFDNDALNSLEDSSKVKRALVILSVVSCILAGGGIWGLLKFTSGSGDLAKLVEIQKFVGAEYNVPQVRANTFNGKAQSLAVILYVPLATFENKAEKERIRQEVFNKVKTRFTDLERFGTLRVVMSSGYNIGIASFNASD